MSGRTFSDVWHRVAGLQVALRPTVRVRKQLFRGETWYLVHDPFNNNFFRIRPEAHQLVTRLAPDRTIGNVWADCLARYPDAAPGQADVVELLAQLHHANLLYYRGAADPAKVFERHERRRQRELQSSVLSVMFARMHLFDPDPLLDRLAPLIRLAFGPLGALIWLVVVAIGAKTALEARHLLGLQSEGLLAPDNWALLYVALVGLKVLHELGHAAMCKRFGGEVHSTGVMLMVFTPLPYMDATSAWGFRSRWHRALVGAAGMIVELFVAALATLVWSRTGQGTALHALAYNVMCVAGVSTLVFNVNPLLRFDGYYIFSDLVDVPNLHQRASEQLTHLAERYLLGYRDSRSPAQTMTGALGLTAFGLASNVYRLFVSLGIVFFVADRFLLVGLVMAAFCVFAWTVLPLGQLLHYLLTSPKLARTRLRAWLVAGGAVGGVVALLAIIPAPVRFRAPGVLEAIEHVQVTADAPGRVAAARAISGARVKAGDVLVELANPEIDLDLAAARAQLVEIEAREQKAAGHSAVDLAPARRRKEEVQRRLDRLEAQRASLTVRAKIGGTWVAPRELAGTWVARGGSLGQIVDDSSFRFAAVVPQDEAGSVFARPPEKAEVRLIGDAGRTLAVAAPQVIPFQARRLPSAALGWRGGGQMAVSQADASGLETTEPFFRVHATLAPAPRLMHGRSGLLRLTLGSEPLLFQWGRRLMQLVQRRYQS